MPIVLFSFHPSLRSLAFYFSVSFHCLPEQNCHSNLLMKCCIVLVLLYYTLCLVHYLCILYHICLSGHDDALVSEACWTRVQVYQRFRHGTCSVDWPGGVHYPILGSQGKVASFCMRIALETIIALCYERPKVMLYIILVIMKQRVPALMITEMIWCRVHAVKQLQPTLSNFVGFFKFLK